MRFCRGVVAVSVDMLQMDINQCDNDYYVPNAFKGTHKCDRKTSYVSASSLFWYSKSGVFVASSNNKLKINNKIIQNSFVSLTVCADFGTFIHHRRVQVRMSTGIRISIWRFNHILRWPIGRGRIRKYREWWQNSLRSIQVPIGRRCCITSHTFRHHV